MNTLRDNVKDAIQKTLIEDCIGDGETADVTLIADAIFDVLKIDTCDQEVIDYKVAVNPKVVAQVAGGMIDVVECDENIDVELRDYDIDDCTDEELSLSNEVVYGETGRYIIR